MRNKKPLLLLFTANAVSGFAQGISMIAIPWHFAQTGESAAFNIMYGITTALLLGWGLFAGTLVDRYSRKRCFMVTTAVCGTLIGSIALWGLSQGSLPHGLIFTVFAITMLNFNIHYPTLYAFGQEVTEPKYYKQTTSTIEVVGQTTSILSGGIAALLLEGIGSNSKLFGYPIQLPFTIPKWEISEIFAMDAVTYLIAFSLIAFIRYKPIRDLNIERGSILKRIKSGFRYLKEHPSVFIFGMASYAVFAMLLVEVHAVLPSYIGSHLQEDGSVLGAADFIYSIGAVAAGALVVRVFRKTNLVVAVITLMLITVGIFYWCAFSKDVMVLYAMSLLLGFTNAGTRVLRVTYLFQEVPNEIIGRVNSIFSLANVTVRSSFIFLFSIPFFSTGSNSTWSYFIMATFILAAAAVLIVKYRSLLPKQ